MRTTKRRKTLRYFFSNEPTTDVDSQINKVLTKMDEVEVDSEEYPALLKLLERLNEIKKESRPDPISRDTIATVFGNLLGIFIIVAYEQKHVLTSKGMNQLIRPKQP